MKAVVEVQRRRQESLDANAQWQVQRWRSMEHQYLQLQRFEREDEASAQPVNQPGEEMQRLIPTTARPSSVEDMLLQMPARDVPTPQQPVHQDPKGNIPELYRPRADHDSSSST